MITILTTAQIRAQIISDIEGRLGVTIPILPKAFIRVLAIALAGVLSLLYRFGLWIYRQIFPQTANAEALVKIGDQFGLSRIPAVRAQVEAEATGENETVLPAGTLWLGPNELVYDQSEMAVIADGVATIILECLTDGEVGNLEIDNVLALVSPIAGADGTATITDLLVIGEDQEDQEGFRSRILGRMQNRPQGGAAPDYVIWAREVPGIVKAFAYRTDPGEVTVYPLIALTGDRIPEAPKLAEVLEYLEDTHRKPLCANVVVIAMTERTFDLTVTGLQPDNATVRLNIETAINDYLLRSFPKQYPDEALPTDIVSAAAMYGTAFAAGAKQITIEMYIDGNEIPIMGHELAEYELAKLGEITWPV